MEMAYPFRPLKPKKLRKLTRAREESNQFIEESNRSPQFESPAADPRQDETRPLFPSSVKINTENIISQL
jgi:hypothetical protein